MEPVSVAMLGLYNSNSALEPYHVYCKGTLWGYCTSYLKIRMFCALSQNYQYLKIINIFLTDDICIL